MIDDLLTAKLLLDGDDKNDSGWGGSAFLWVILIFLFFLAFSGNGLFGRGNGDGLGAVAAMAATNFRDNNLSQMERDILETSNATQKEAYQNRFDLQLANQNLMSQLQQCCCDLKTTIISENQITRDLFQANYIDSLRTSLSDAKTQLTNQAQTQYILSQIGQYYTHPSVNPYTCYTRCNCCSSSGTTTTT